MKGLRRALKGLGVFSAVMFATEFAGRWLAAQPGHHGGLHYWTLICISVSAFFASIAAML